MMLLLHLVVVVMAAAAWRAEGREAEDGRAVGWFWDFPFSKYIEQQPAEVYPEAAGIEPVVELREEGRRRSDDTEKRNKPAKDLRQGALGPAAPPLTANIAITATKGHNVPVLPVAAPVATPVITQAVDIPATPWNFNWLTKLLNTATPAVATPAVAAAPAVGRPIGGLGLNANLQGSLTINKPGVVAPVVPPARPVLPTKTEVMVLRFPEFIKTIGQGIKKVSNAVQDFGLLTSATIANKFSGGLGNVPTAIGAGVAAIIPLDQQNTVQKPGLVLPALPTIPKPVLPALPTIPKPNLAGLGNLFTKGTGLNVAGTGTASLTVNKGTGAQTAVVVNG